jgi:acyl carrier protein phosphodiesterase
MNKVKIKITGYDEASHSLLVSFASDTTKSQDPASYPSYAFQPLTMWPDVTDVNELKRRLAVSGMHHAQMQEAKEKFMADPSRVAALKALVGQAHEFSVNDLSVVDFQTPMATV